MYVDALDIGVPEALDWYVACEDDADDKGLRDDYNTQQDLGHYLRKMEGEDAQVEHQDGNLGEGQTEAVEDRNEPATLPRVC